MLAVEPQVIEGYVRSGVVKLVFRDVLNHRERSDHASEAAACAGQQGYFWEMHELLFTNQSMVWGTSNDGLLDLMVQFGSQVEGLDQETYSRCLLERSTLEKLKASDAEQRSRGITAQPIFEINDQRLYGLQSFETMSVLIEEVLK